jgi:hypothetical protein
MRAKVTAEKAGMWLGHYSMLALWAVIAVTITGDATGQQHHGGVMTWITAAAWTVWVVALLADMRRHQETLCERCVAAIPLDPQAAVTERKAILRAYHGSAVLILEVVALACVIPLLLFSLGQPPLWAYVLDAPAVLAIGALSVITWQHRRLYPWCPFCRWEDGGGHEVSPDVPAPAVTR